MRFFKQIKWLLFTKKISGKQCLITACRIFLFFFSFSSSAQFKNTVWCFGDSAGIDFNDTANITTFSSGMDSRGSCVSIADSSGALLFYAYTRGANNVNSCTVRNKQHQIMENGDNMIGENWYSELIILPISGQPNRFYLFSLLALSPYGLYYSIIDINENAGLGKVVERDIQIGTDRMWDAMAALKHANGRDYWLITKDWNNPNGDNVFHIDLITPDSIIRSTQAIGYIQFGNLGVMTFSKDGNKFLFTTYNGMAEVLDFNRCTGQFSNPVKLANAWAQYRKLGSAFSPDGSKAYIARADTNSWLYQYDLNASNPQSSQTTITTIIRPIEAGGSLRLAPDNKIYWSCAWTNQITTNFPYQDTMYHPENMNLSVINSPNSLGAACDLSMYSFYLGGKRTYWGLPNNPNYSLGPVTSSICDTLTGIEHPQENVTLCSITPNPNNGNFILQYNGINEKAEIDIFDITGKLLLHEKIYSNKTEFNLSSVPSGLYVIVVTTEKFRWHSKIVKQ